MSIAYGLWARRRWPGTLPIGYANGMIGYTQTAAQLRRGGYEAIEAPRYYLLPGSYRPDIGDRIKEGIERLMERQSEGSRP